jgi:hypothetical protein
MAGISRLLKEKGREKFWPKKGNLRRTRKNLKNGQNFTPFRVNKFLTYLRHFRWLPNGAGIIKCTNKKKYIYIFFLKGQGSKRALLVATGVGALLKMPSRSTIPLVKSE